MEEIFHKGNYTSCVREMVFPSLRNCTSYVNTYILVKIL